MSKEDYKKRCENISIGKSFINQSDISSNFWKKMSSEKRDKHSKNVSISKKIHYKKVNELKNKRNLTEDEKLVLINEENRIKSLSQKLKAIFEVRNNITGEKFIVVSVDELCKLVGVSKFIYKYNLSKKNYIINNYEFKKIK
jgi:hypothetical protein